MAAAAAVCIWLALDHFYQQNTHQWVADMERALYVEPSGGPVTRRDGRVELKQIDVLGEQLLFSMREQRTLALIVFAALFSIALLWLGARVKRIHRPRSLFLQPNKPVSSVP